MPRRPMPSRRRAISADSIVVWGFSLGTGVAVALAAEQRIGKLILEAPYTSIADVAASAFWFAPVRLLMRDQFRSDERIARVKVPLLVMHGALDPAIPVRVWRAAVCAGERAETVCPPCPAAVITIWTISARIEIARNFINACKGLTAAVVGA